MYCKWHRILRMYIRVFRFWNTEAAVLRLVGFWSLIEGSLFTSVVGLKAMLDNLDSSEPAMSPLQ